ncbi:MAG: ROK family protein [Actinomycetota bacterium]
MAERSGLGVGVDIGGTKSLGVLVDDQGEVLAESRVPTPDGASELLDMVAAVVAELTELAGAVDGVGVGVPGIVDAEGRLRYAPNLVGADELAVRELLQLRFDVPIVVANDTDCAAWAEHTLGAARGHGEAMLVTLGTGIGTSIIVDGRVQLGANGFAGELGHHVVDPVGVECSCGNRGCWETKASATGLARLAVETIGRGRGGVLKSLVADDPSSLRGEHVTRAAREGDQTAIEIIDEFAGWVALGLANGVAILDPSLIVVGGGLVAEHELLLDPVRSRFDGMIFANGHRPQVTIVPAALGERAGALGAAVLARDAGQATHSEAQGALR